MQALVHRRDFRVQWGQCDPAGIVFYPQFLILFDTATGELFERTGLSATAMRKKYGIIGMPLVEQGTKFLLPCRFDEVIVVESRIAEWGRSSFTVRHRVLKRDEVAVEGFEKRVWAVADPNRAGGIKAEAIPPEILAALGGEKSSA
jgi:4-hydroxybenzoyl-CoA thioesterase